MRFSRFCDKYVAIDATLIPPLLHKTKTASALPVLFLKRPLSLREISQFFDGWIFLDVWRAMWQVHIAILSGGNGLFNPWLDDISIP